MKTPLMTGYYCKLLFGDSEDNYWSKVAEALNTAITTNNYPFGIAYIQSLDISNDKKDSLEKCLMSYKGSC